MSDPTVARPEKPSLDALQFVQDNLDRDTVSQISRTCKVVLATGGNVGVDADIPVGSEIFDVTVLCTRSNGGGTMTVKDVDDNDITDAITCATDGAVTRAGTIDDDYHVIQEEGVTVYANASGDGGIVYIHYIKP